jgi:hypothetical protein
MYAPLQYTRKISLRENNRFDAVWTGCKAGCGSLQTSTETNKRRKKFYTQDKASEILKTLSFGNVYHSIFETWAYKRNTIVQYLYNFNYFNGIQHSLFYRNKLIPCNRKANWVICCYKIRRLEHRHCILLRTGSVNITSLVPISLRSVLLSSSLLSSASTFLSAVSH